MHMCKRLASLASLQEAMQVSHVTCLTCNKQRQSILNLSASAVMVMM